MKLTYRCPVCERMQRQTLTSGTHPSCEQCDWTRETSAQEGMSEACLVCGCPDLWKQKNFPQRLGLLFVAVGAIASTIAWAWYRPGLAIGILMAFALLDMLLFLFMPDVLVCYRCKSRHSPDEIDAEHPLFNLETAERYRQQQLRS